MTKGEHAAQRVRSGCNCAQSVLGEFADDLGLDLDLADSVAGGFGGGIGGLGGSCGAVTGGTMVIGLLTCGPTHQGPSAEASIDGLVQDFVRRFQAEHGSALCRDLLGCDVSTPEGLAAAKDQGLFDTRCPVFVSRAVEILQDMFPEELA